jgi:hypothetical protein
MTVRRFPALRRIIFTYGRSEREPLTRLQRHSGRKRFTTSKAKRIARRLNFDSTFTSRRSSLLLSFFFSRFVNDLILELCYK